MVCTARNAAAAGGGGRIIRPPPPLLTIFRHAEASVGLESVGDHQLCLAQEAHRPVSEHVRVVSTRAVNTLLKFLIR